MNSVRPAATRLPVALKRTRFSPPPASAQFQVNSAQTVQLCRSQLELYFHQPIAHLSTQLLEKAFNDLQTRPLLLALQDPYSLGHLSFTDYRKAMESFRPATQLLEQRHFDQLVVLLQTADFYLHLGYRLSVYDISTPETVDRVVLSTALREIGIFFQEHSKRLSWPGPSIQEHRLDELFSQLPRADPSVLCTNVNTLEQQLMQFEKLSQRAGTWIISLDSFIAKRARTHPNFQRLMTTMIEDRFVSVDLSWADWPDAQLTALANARAISFLFCNPVPLSYWQRLLDLSRSWSQKPVSVLFIFEPELPTVDSQLRPLLRAAGFPELNIAIDGDRPLGHRWDFDPEDILGSPALFNSRDYNRSMIRQLSGPPGDWSDLPPISWVPERYYSETVEWFSRLCSDSEMSVRLLTSTKQESNQIWADFNTVLGLNGQLMAGMQVVLRGDPMGAVLSITEIQHDPDDGNQYFVLAHQIGTIMGDGFTAGELDQAYICPLERLIHRHYDILIYFSAQPISVETLYRLTSMAYRRVILLTEQENMHLLFPQ